MIPEGDQPVALSLDLFNESKYNAMSDDGQRVQRVDAFKGFTAEQLARIEYENKLVALDNIKRKQKEREEEFNWAIHQLQVLQHMEEIAQREEQQKRWNNSQLSEDNRRKQMDDQYQRQRWANERYGKIENNYGIYDGFGKSCR